MGPIPGFTTPNALGQLPLHRAAAAGQESAVSDILRRLRENNEWDARDAQDDKGYTALHEAADYNCVRIVDILLTGGVTVDIPDKQTRFAIHVAAKKGHEVVIDWLLNWSSSPRAQDINLQTPLHLASAEGRERAVETLLRRAGETKDTRDKEFQPPLYYAAFKGHKSIAQRLKDAGASVEAPKNGQSLLHQMASTGHADAAEILVDLDADKEAVDNSGRTPLYAAAQGNHEKTFLLLHSKRANKNVVDSGTRRTLLHRAAYEGSVEATVLLLKVDAAKEEVDKKGQTPLYLAAKRDQGWIAKLLADAGADRESPDASQQTLLHRAARENDAVAAAILCDVVAQKEARDDQERTPLYVAAELNHGDVVRILEVKGADVSAPNAQGETLLHRAAREGNKEAADLLIGVDAPRNAQDHDGRTPLHVAATHAIGVVEKLLETEAKKDLRDNNGQTALHVAASRGDDAAAMMKTLIDYGASTVTQDKKGQTPLHAAAIRGDLDILIVLAENPAAKAAQDTPDFSGQTALHVAAEHGRVDAVQLLINEDLDVEAIDDNGRTPLHIAAEHGRAEVVQRLLAADANRAAKDKLGQYPLHLAATNGNVETMDLLTDTSEFVVPLPETMREYVVFVRKFVQDNLHGVFNADDPRVKKLAEQATTKLPHIVNTWGLPFSDGPGLVKLMLYDFVILCDDSRSMHKGYRERITELRDTLQHVVKIALSMQLYDSGGIKVRFLNYEHDANGEFDNVDSVEEVTRKVDMVFSEKRSGSQLGTKLLTKVVNPMIRDKIRFGQFRNPLIVVLITDGEPSEEKRETLENTIRECRRFLNDQSFGDGSVIFLLSQVGDDWQATNFLRGIEQNPEIQDMVYCSEQRLGDMLAVATHGRSDPFGATVNLIQLFLAALRKQSV